MSQSSGVRRDDRMLLSERDRRRHRHSEAFVKSTVAPFVKVLEVLADGRPIPIDGDIVLPAGVKQLEVRYTATSQAVPSRVLFRYRLEGTDAGWVDAGTRRAAFYTNLPGGRYRFHVIATITTASEPARRHALVASSARSSRRRVGSTAWAASASCSASSSCAAGASVTSRNASARWRIWSKRAPARCAGNRGAASHRGVAAHVERRARGSRARAHQRAARRAGADADGHGERRRLEEQLAQVQKLESIGRLAGGVAHDFNNVLTVVLSYSDLLDAGLGPAHPLQAQLRQIRKAAERASNLTHRLLAFARKQVIEPRVINLSELSLEPRRHAPPPDRRGRRAADRHAARACGR